MEKKGNEIYKKLVSSNEILSQQEINEELENMPRDEMIELVWELRYCIKEQGESLLGYMYMI